MSSEPKVEREDAKVTVLHHPPGIQAGCAKCRTILNSGTFAVRVQVGNHDYLVGNNPPKMCCGEEKKVPLLFNNEPLAAFAAQGIVDILNRDGDTSGLRLLEVAQFISTAKH